jgi:hypothetical protein
VLTQHHEVTEAVVVVREDRPGNKRLIGYIVVLDGLSYTEDLTRNIKVYLRKLMPEYMVPETLVILPTIPKTPSGKIDRRALPILNPVVQPRTEPILLHGTHKVIAEVWQKILKIEKVSSNDNFFDLGGNSLLLVQVREQLQTIFAQEISMIEMFQQPTITALAEYFNTRASKKDIIENDGSRINQDARKQQRQIRQNKRSDINWSLD